MDNTLTNVINGYHKSHDKTVEHGCPNIYQNLKNKTNTSIDKTNTRVILFFVPFFYPIFEKKKTKKNDYFNTSK